MQQKLRQIELLSPARNLATGIEAINCGADAVYIGAEAFGARHAAGNSVEDIGKLVDYAHLYGAKVYVTINTILYDDELEAARQLAMRLYEIGVDALITQDLALAEMNLPIPLHASTQMDNRTVEHVKRLQSWGYEQVVLARELGIKDIATIHKACPDVALEAFIHGALCVSYSGRCYASQYCFDRSANRGECAQFCRLAFDLENEQGRKLITNKHLLSLKDMNRSASLEEMIDAGITSFKIEGRLKDIAYVKNVTAYYHRALNEIIRRRSTELQRASYGTAHIDFEPDLSKSFNRDYTEYFLHGRTEEVASINTPKSIGQEVGSLKRCERNYITLRSIHTFHNGDGLCFFDTNGNLQGFRVNRVENNKIFPHPYPKNLLPNTILYRNHDAEFDAALQRPTPKRTLGLKISMQDCEEGYLLTATDERNHTSTLTAAMTHETARSPQTDRIKKELSKTGDTQYHVEDVNISFAKDYFIPASQISQMRRELLGQLSSLPIERSPLNNEKTCNSAPKTDILPLTTNSDGQGRVTIPYTANVSNQQARAFLRSAGATDIEPAFELKTPEGNPVIMTCRHCIKYTLGMCQKRGGKAKTPSHLFLALPDGRRFALNFDCRKCEMQVSVCKQ